MKKRKTIIAGLLSLGIETFGDPDGWKELFGNTIITHPNIDYRRQLASVYQSIAINLNITSCQMPTAVNQRVFDVPMAGGFVISDKQKDMDELFKPGEIAVYESVEDLQEKVRFYLDHETRRRAITERAQKRILGEHTYAHRIKKIISSL
jgi:spore maturation protein CgeB